VERAAFFDFFSCGFALVAGIIESTKEKKRGRNGSNGSCDRVCEVDALD
jgi:hypothetical protein